MRQRRWLTRLGQLRRFDQRFRRLGYRHLAGVDEVGRGPLAGPVVAAAVLLRRQTLSAPIDDSKRLTPAARRRAFDVIVANAAIGIAILDARAVDTLNIFQASLKAMQEAVAALPSLPDGVLVDGPWPLDGVAVPVMPILHGDRRSMVVACASIIAKVVRDRLMVWYDRQHPAYGFARHKGYPTAAHLAALVRHGPSPIHRRSFRPVARHAELEPV